MSEQLMRNLETDERFPSGEWKGFWLQRPQLKDRQKMDLSLTFADGKIRGDGNDMIGAFTMQGRYDVKSGKVTINKYYVGQHHVLYEGWAEPGKGIWGVWSIPNVGKDGFHLWPKGMRDPSQQGLKAEVSAPLDDKKAAVLVDG